MAERLPPGADLRESAPVPQTSAHSNAKQRCNAGPLCDPAPLLEWLKRKDARARSRKAAKLHSRSGTVGFAANPQNSASITTIGVLRSAKLGTYFACPLEHSRCLSRPSGLLQ